MPASTYKAGTYAAVVQWLEESKARYNANPKSGKSKERYEQYSKATTIGEALSLGALPADLLFDYEKGHLAVSEPFRAAPLDLFAVQNFEELTYTDKVLARYAYLADPGTGGVEDASKIKVLEESIRKQKSINKRLGKIEIASQLGIKEVDLLADDKGFWETPEMSSRRCVANTQAGEMLATVEREGRKVTDFELLAVLRLWDFRENLTRQNVMKEGQTFIYSDTLGLVCDRTGLVICKEETRRYSAFGRLVNRWFRDHVPEDLPSKFTYTSINVNKNYAGRLHRDGNNVGPSFIKAFGDFSGGQLNYYAEDDKEMKLDELEKAHGDKSVKLDVSKGLLLFDGKRGHYVDDFEGERYSLVFFTCPRFERVSSEHREFQDASEFPFPTEDTMKDVLSILRKPKGYAGKKSGDERAGAPYVFSEHTGAEKLAREQEAEAYWTQLGLRTRLETNGGRSSSRVQYLHSQGRKDRPWNEDHLFFVLPTEPSPSRAELILPDFKNMPDACVFLNNADSKLPEAVTKAGCAALFGQRTKVWYVLYRKDMKREEVLQLFDLDAAPPKPKRVLKGDGGVAAATPPAKSSSVGSKSKAALETPAAAKCKASSAGSKRKAAPETPEFRELTLDELRQIKHQEKEAVAVANRKASSVGSKRKAAPETPAVAKRKATGKA